MKTCTKCGEEKPLEAFAKNKASADGHQYMCRLCFAAYHQANKERLAPQQRGARLKRKYGLSASAWDALWDAQAGRCLLCERSMTRNASGQSLRSTDAVVDHSNETRTVNGLLCNRCNIAIGHFYHDPYLLARAAQYCNDVRNSDEFIEHAPLGRVPD